MGMMKQKYLEEQQYLEEKQQHLDSFDVDMQCEDVPYEDSELILIDATSDGTEDEFRLVKCDGLFYLEHWDPSTHAWKVQDSMSPNEVLAKLKGLSV
jgi:hypothetical protein